MAQPPTSSALSVYQLRVVIRRVSPLIRRRLLVRSDGSTAHLRTTLQISMGWTDEHLNRFVIHGREYGISHVGGIGFRDDPHQVRLVDLGLRVGERFIYEYDFTDSWQHDVRLEQILPLEPHRRYPTCSGEATPGTAPGLCWAAGVSELRQRHSHVDSAERLITITTKTSCT